MACIWIGKHEAVAGVAISAFLVPRLIIEWVNNYESCLDNIYARDSLAQHSCEQLSLHGAPLSHYQTSRSHGAAFCSTQYCPPISLHRMAASPHSPHTQTKLPWGVTTSSLATSRGKSPQRLATRHKQNDAISPHSTRRPRRRLSFRRREGSHVLRSHGARSDYTRGEYATVSVTELARHVGAIRGRPAEP